ncbi:MAG TPA: hypothetical protein IAD34_00515 [Candidatus Scatovicinus merdipullorum]|nr:hypothetical protein [Candidatus Scatovicinus merdipullorum]
MKRKRQMEHNSIWALDNPYTYRVNINHPKIQPLFERYKQWKGVPIWCPLSDSERFEFERYIIRNIFKSKRKSA